LKTLGTTLLIKNANLKSGDKIVIAIRTNKIKIVPSDNHVPSKLLCQIKNIYETSHYNQILAVPYHNLESFKEEIIIDFYDKKTHKYEHGQNISVYLSPDEIHFFKDDIGC
jgi:ABC-type sugar transport system ATPase subunit